MSKQANLMFIVGLKVMMSRHQHTHPPRFFWSLVNTVSPFVLISLRYKANELVQAMRLKVPCSKSSVSAKFSYLIPEQLMRMI